jgi:hypothetical protein
MKKIITLLALISLGTGFVHAQTMNMSVDTPDGSMNMGMDVKETPDGGLQMNMRMDTPDGAVNMGVSADDNGMNSNMKVQEKTTTTTTTTTSTKTTIATSTPVIEDQAVEMPASAENANPNKCMYAMSSSDFSNALASIKKQTFEDTKLQVAKQMADANCLSSAQVKSLMGLFTYEESKLDIAKYCYKRTIDRNNYYLVNEVFTYSSSVEELHQYMSGTK